MRVPATLLILAALLGCEQPLEVETVQPRQAAIRQTFREPATTRLRDPRPVFAPVAGRVARITLEPGDRVEKGQVLATYDLTPFDSRIAEVQAGLAELDVREALSKDDRLEQVAREEAVTAIQSIEEALKASKAQIEAAKARAENRQRVLDRMKKVQAAERAVSLSALDDAQLEVDLAVLAIREREFAMTSLKAFALAMRLGPRFVDEYLLRERLDRKLIDRQRKTAQVALARATYQRSLAVVTSPIAGVVLARHERGGRPVPAGAPLLLLGDLAQLEAVAEVLSGDALRLAEGSPVRLDPGRGLPSLTGTVSRIEPSGFTKRSALGVEQQRVNVRIAFDAPPRRLGSGYRLQAEFGTGARDGALVVPRFSVLQAPDRTHYVFKVAGGKLVRQPVEIGLTSDLQMEITQGLTAADRIVAQPDSTMAEGRGVKP